MRLDNAVSRFPRSRRFAGAAIVLTGLLLASNAGTATRWKIVPSPSSGTLNQLNAAAAISGSDAWAVGTTGLPDFNSQGVTLHWNGRTWQSIPNPMPAGAVEVNLLGVAAAASDDVWAVGRWGDADTLTVNPLMLHWDGSKWRIVDTPTLSGGATFQAVTAIAPDDVWAVGEDGTGRLAEHWDGQSWSVVPTPRQNHDGDLTAVGGTSSTDVWAVGSFLDNKFRTHTQILHWNGTAWSISPSPDNGESSELEGVAAISSNDVWAVGHSFPSNVATLTEHWDGTAWTVVPGPALDIAQLNAVVAVSSNDVWAVGWVLGPNAQAQTLAENWNGSKWVYSPTPPVSSQPRSNQTSEFLGIAVSPQAVLAVGDAIGNISQSPQQTLMEVHVP
jgi:hypothetical protein